jgi:hypothetical protein
MDRRDQLKNVAFGGAWSDQIPGQETLARAIKMVIDAPERAGEEDLREDAELEEALRHCCAAHPKGEQLRRSWDRALNLPDPGQRQAELARVAKILETWVAAT